jgi:tRNA A37 methylthiotransferase MiaB
MSGKVPFNTRENRSRRLISLSENKHLEFSAQNINRTAEVLFEHNRSEGMITGFTGNYLRAEYPWKTSLAGTIKTARLTGISGTGRMTVELID